MSMHPTWTEKNISTHAPRVRRDINAVAHALDNRISTHAPRVRRDTVVDGQKFDSKISTHAPRVRRDGRKPVASQDKRNFYSRASCEARLTLYTDKDEAVNFYSRASCEARPR